MSGRRDTPRRANSSGLDRKCLNPICSAAWSTVDVHVSGVRTGSLQRPCSAALACSQNTPRRRRGVPLRIAETIGWAAAAVVWLYAIMFLFINDEVKILTVHLLFAHPADMPFVDEGQVS